MEAGLKERSDALETKQQDWETVTKMRESELEVSASGRADGQLAALSHRLLRPKLLEPSAGRH